MAADRLLLSDGTSNLLLSDGVSVLLLSTSSGGATPSPETTPYLRTYSLNGSRSYDLDARRSYRSH